MKIVSIQKRHPVACLFGINHWRVGVETDGKIGYFNCWAGIDEPREAHLLWSLKEKMEIKLRGSRTVDFSSLVGKEFNI